MCVRNYNRRNKTDFFFAPNFDNLELLIEDTIPILWERS